MPSHTLKDTMKDLEKSLTKLGTTFATVVAGKYNLDVEELKVLWNDTMGKTSKKRSPNAFQLFSKEQRPKLKQSEPDLTFGQVGKRLGEMWKALSDEDKAKFKSS